MSIKAQISSLLNQVEQNVVKGMFNNSSSSCGFKNHAEYCLTIEIVVRLISTFAFLSSIIVLILIFILKKYRFTSQRLVLYLVLATLAYTLHAAIGSIDMTDSILCTIEGFVSMFTIWVLIISVCNIAVNLFWNIIIGKPSNIYLEIFYICVTLGLPLVISIIPFIDNSYGPAGLWCWIGNSRPLEKILRFALMYVPLWITSVFLFLLFIIITAKLLYEVRRWGPYHPQTDKKKNLIQREIKPLIRYPITFLIFCIIPTINRVQNIIAPTSPIFALYLLHAISTPSAGLTLSLMFFMSRDTLKELKWSNFKQAVLARFSTERKVEKLDVVTERSYREHSVVVSDRSKETDV